MKALVVVACWMFPALLFTPVTYLIHAGSDSPFTLALAFTLNASWHLLWAALTPIILWLGRHFPIERPRLARHVLIHALAAAVLGVAHIGMSLPLNTAILRLFRHDYVPRSTPAAVVMDRIAYNALVYFGALAMTQALQYARKYREREFRLAEAELQALRTQLNPHFLFNSLNAVAELVHEQPSAAEDGITRLSELLRLALATGKKQEVPLEEELSFIRKYVEMQQTLLGDRLEFVLDIDDDILDAAVPNMLLQPFVENSLRHGIAGRSRGGRIDIAACRGPEGQLHLQVRDDGVGRPLARGWNERTGLVNTRARLAYLYPGTHRIDVRESPGGGVTVHVTIPYRSAS